MNTQETHTHLSTKYKPIPGSERIEIVKALVENQLTASQVSDMTGYNLSTIKAIYRVYKQEGRMWKKEKRDQLIQRTQNLAICLVDDFEQKAQFVAARQIESEIVQNQSDKMKQEDLCQLQIIQFFKDNQHKIQLLLKDQDNREEVNKQFSSLHQTQFQDISKISNKTKKVQKWKKVKKYFKRQQQDIFDIKQKDFSSNCSQLTIEDKIKDLTKVLQSQMNYMIQNYNTF